MFRLLPLFAVAAVCAGAVYLIAKDKAGRAHVTARAAPDAATSSLTTGLDGSARSRVTAAVLRAADGPVDPESQIDEAEQVSLSTRFEAGTRDIESEKRILPTLERVFGSTNAVTYEVECRAAICRVTSDVEGWEQRISAEDGFESIDMGARFTFLELSDPEQVKRESEQRARTEQILRSFISAAEESVEVADCLRLYPVPSGDVRLVVRVVSRSVTVSADGSLATHNSGRCIARAAERALQAVVLPSDVPPLPEFALTIRVPQALESNVPL